MCAYYNHRALTVLSLNCVYLNMIYRSNFLVIRGLGLGLVFIKCGMIILVYIYYESTCVPRKVEKSPWTRRGRVDESS
jgi:hypothetical protein